MNAVQANPRQYFFIRAIWTIQREEDLPKMTLTLGYFLISSTIV